jgi:pimeloyl-ACP methyl ester carboxylesterase
MSLSPSVPRLFYQDRGDGEPLLLFTGFSVSSAVFEPLADSYGQHFRCLTFDYRGTGRSARWIGLPSMAALAADGLRILDAVGVRSAHVYGVSMGGMVAQEFAIRFPHRVRGLILAGTSPGGPLGARPSARRLAAVASRVGGGTLRHRHPWLAPALFSESFAAREPERAQELQRYFEVHPAPPWASAGQFLASVYHDRARQLHRIRAPTLILHGELDAISPVANARQLAAGIPDSELQLIAGAGHAFPLEVPEGSLRAVLEWLARRPDVAGGPPPSPIAAAVERVGRPLALPGGMLRTGLSAVAGMRGTCARITTTEKRSNP